MKGHSAMKGSLRRHFKRNIDPKPTTAIHSETIQTPTILLGKLNWNVCKINLYCMHLTRYTFVNVFVGIIFGL